MDKSNQLNQLGGQLSRLSRLRVADWGGIPEDLAGVRERALELADLASEAQELPLSALPGWMIDGLFNVLSPLANDMERFIAALKPGTLPEHDRESAINRGRAGGPQGLYEGTRDLLNAFNYLGVRAAKFAGARERCETAVNGIQDTNRRWAEWFRDAGDQFKQLRDESDKLIRQLKSAAGENGVARFAGTFEALAKEHASSLTKWLWACIVFGALAIGFAFLFLVAFPIKGDLEQFENVYILVTRLVVIGFTAVGCGWCASMYRVRAHLAEVNRHRATALATFRLFVESADGPQARDAVLKASLRAIFAPGLTGLVNSKDEKANNEIFDVIQSMLKGG